MKRVDAAREIFQQRDGDAEVREGWEDVGVDAFDGVLGGGREICAVAEDLRGEVVACDGGFVCSRRDVEVGGEFRVGGLGGEEERHEEDGEERHAK